MMQSQEASDSLPSNATDHAVPVRPPLGGGDRLLTAIPVYNEVAHVDAVVAAVHRISPHVLVVDDGSCDGTFQRLQQHASVQHPAVQDRRPYDGSGVRVLTHPRNLGYGAALASAFDFAVRHDYQWLVTIDCDGQHQPGLIGKMVETACRRDVDIVSGSRYLRRFAADNQAPPQRRRVNRIITRLLNRRLKLRLTDAFCGFKCYRVTALRKLRVTEFGYGMPLQVWVQAAIHRLRIVELPVPRIYTQESRTFGSVMDDAQRRMRYYLGVIENSLSGLENRSAALARSPGDVESSSHFLPAGPVASGASTLAICDDHENSCPTGS